MKKKTSINISEKEESSEIDNRKKKLSYKQI
jgi:hypothetical protein